MLPCSVIATRRHLQLDRAIQQLLDPAGAVEQRELRVQVEMDEISHLTLLNVELSNADY